MAHEAHGSIVEVHGLLRPLLLGIFADTLTDFQASIYFIDERLDTALIYYNFRQALLLALRLPLHYKKKFSLLLLPFREIINIRPSN